MKAMQPTKAAGELIDQYAKWYKAGPLALVLGRAQQIARRQRATRLGKVHIETAVQELAAEIEWKGESDDK